MAPNPGREELLQRTRDLLPRLRERAPEVERMRRIHPDTVADFQQSRLFRIHQPARVGGLEMDFNLTLEIGELIASACASTAWVYVNIVSHDWMLGMWPQRGQDEVWDEDPDTLIGSALIYPPGRVERVDGGYLLSGRWPFSSGIDPCDWLMLGGMLRDGDGPPEPRMFQVRRSSIEVIDTWHVAGLVGSGSQDVQGENIFVPEYMTLNPRDARGGPTPGSECNPGPLYKLPILALFPHVIGGPILGMARGCYEDYLAQTRDRVSTYNSGKIAEHTPIQLRIAEAGANIDAARLLLHDSGCEATEIALSGAAPDGDTKARWRRDAAFVARMAHSAAQTIFTAAGGGANYLANPLQRHMRDILAGVGHIGVSWDVNGAEFGRTAVGLPHGNPNV